MCPTEGPSPHNGSLSPVGCLVDLLHTDTQISGMEKEGKREGRGKEEGRKEEGGKEEGRREGGSIALHSYSDYIHTHLGSKVRYDYKFLEYILWQDVSEASLFDVIRGDVDMVGPQVQVSG